MEKKHKSKDKSKKEKKHKSKVKSKKKKKEKPQRDSKKKSKRKRDKSQSSRYYSQIIMDYGSLYKKINLSCSKSEEPLPQEKSTESLLQNVLDYFSSINNKPQNPIPLDGSIVEAEADKNIPICKVKSLFKVM